MPKVMPMFVKD